jgi:preprotein translocase SecE subunit
MKAYKSDQGRMVRMAGFWILALLYLYGCMSLNDTLGGFVDSLGENLLGTVPILGWNLTGAFLISALLFLAGFYLIWAWQQTPKIADLLIDTEAELQKVTWAKMPEVINTSLVVIGFVLFLMVFLAGADIVLSRVFSFILGGNIA